MPTEELTSTLSASFSANKVLQDPGQAILFGN